MYCNKCGNKVKENDTFCGKCGNQLTGDQVSNVAPSKPEVVFVGSGEKKSNTGLIIGIVIGVMVLVIAVIAGLIVLFRAKTNNKIYEPVINHEEKEKTPVYSYDRKTIKYGNISLEYDGNIWEEMENSTEKTKDSELISVRGKNTSYGFVFIRLTSENVTNSYDFTKRLEDTYKEKGYTILNKVGQDTRTINGLKWYIIEYLNDNHQHFYQLVYVDNSGLYTLTYISGTDNYYTGLVKFYTVMFTLKNNYSY